MGQILYAQVFQAEESNQHEHGTLRLRPKRVRCTLFWVVLFCASLSIITNGVVFYTQLHHPWELSNALPTRYARLTRNIPLKFVRHTPHDSIDRNVQDAAWNASDLITSTGFVALSDDYAAELSLPHSQRWPWDSSKGVYILQAHHELHCLHTFREAYNQYRDGVRDEDRIWSYSHIMHCLNILRQSIMCNADDTPLYTGRLHANVNSTEPRAGIGMTRMCRNWHALSTWACSHSACYEFEHHGRDHRSGVDLYKSCPDGARPWETVGLPETR